jgi:hypothetical protein
MSRIQISFVRSPNSNQEGAQDYLIDVPKELEHFSSWTLQLLIRGALASAAEEKKEKMQSSVDESPFKDIKFTPLPVADNPLWKKR